MSGRVVHVNDNVEGAVYIGRAVNRKRLQTHPLANPFKIGKDGDREMVLLMYEWWLTFDFHDSEPDQTALANITTELIALRGKPLACWCRHDGETRTDDNACHGDVLLEVLDTYTDDQLRAMGGKP